MRRTATLALVSACALAGCGGSGSGGSEKATTVPAGQTVSVTAREYSFSPSAIVIPNGRSVRFELRNDGAQAHDLRIQKGGDDLGGTPIFGPNQTKSTTVNLAPGTYDFVCTVGDHEQLGMKGKLTVK
jgi:plastocyanin